MLPMEHIFIWRILEDRYVVVLLYFIHQSIFNINTVNTYVSSETRKPAGSCFY